MSTKTGPESRPDHLAADLDAPRKSSIRHKIGHLDPSDYPDTELRSFPYLHHLQT
ncbi:MAG: hypothetical protein H6568_05800 [Lewinellaceae bacterium]|nr:hypothetical protein [Lewinellaceae bacterium]